MAEYAIKIGEAFRFGWQTFKSNLWLLLGVFVVQFFLPRLIVAPAGEREDAFAFALFLISGVVSLLMSVGVIKITLAFVDGGKPVFADLFRHYRSIPKYLAVSLIYGIVVGIGFILLIIPGIYLALKYQFASYLSVDKNTGVFEAFTRSAQMTAGVKWNLLQFLVLDILLNFLGVLAIGIGLIVTIPITMLAYGKVYRELDKARPAITPVPPAVPAAPVSPE